MEQYQINGKAVLFIFTGDNACHQFVTVDGKKFVWFNIFIRPFRFTSSHTKDLPEGRWTFVCNTQNINEKIAESLFPCVYNGADDPLIRGNIYECFDESDFICDTASDSFLSFLKAKKMVGNHAVLTSLTITNN